MGSDASIETGRLLLRPLVVDDAAEMAAVLADPCLYELTGGAPETSSQLATRYARWVAGPSKPGQQWLNLVVRERMTLRAVGYVQATINPQASDVAWVIGVPWQRCGYAIEATRAMVEHLVREHRVSVLRALIRFDHAASQRIAVHLGLTRTGEVVDGEEVWLGRAARQMETQAPSTGADGAR